jgi:hypothetical protein
MRIETPAPTYQRLECQWPAAFGKRDLMHALERSRCSDVQEAASHTDARTTMRYDRARVSLDRHATYIVATFVAGASR